LKTIGEIFKSNLKRLRQSSPDGLRQEDIDERLGLAPNTYQRWEAGKLPREDDRISALAALFGVSVGELFLDSDLIPVTPSAPPTIEALAKNNEHLVKIIEQQERRIQELESQKPAASAQKQAPQYAHPEITRDILAMLSAMNEDEAAEVLHDMRLRFPWAIPDDLGKSG